MPLQATGGCVGEMHGLLTLIQCLNYGEAKGVMAHVSKRSSSTGIFSDRRDDENR